MAKCENCGEEYPDGTEHVCSPPAEDSTKAEEPSEPEEPQPEGKDSETKS